MKRPGVNNVRVPGINRQRIEITQLGVTHRSRPVPARAAIPRNKYAVQRSRHQLVRIRTRLRQRPDRMALKSRFSPDHPAIVADEYSAALARRLARPSRGIDACAFL